MKFQITIKRYGWLWEWQVSDGPYRDSDITLTKLGAIWSANRRAKRWAQDKLDELQKESWEVNF